MGQEDLRENQSSKGEKVKELLNGHIALYDFLKARAEEEKTSVENLVMRLIQTYKEWVDVDEAERRQQELKGKVISLPEGMDSVPPKQKTWEFFEALIDKDFKRAYAIINRNFRWLNLEQSDYYSNVIRIITIGEPYQKGNRKYANGKGVFVPYEIELENVRIRRGFIAMRNDNPDGRSDIPEGEWVFDGGL